MSVSYTHLNKEIELVATFKYLCDLFSEGGSPHDDLSFKQALRFFQHEVLGKSEVWQKTKLAVYKSVYASTLT